MASFAAAQLLQARAALAQGDLPPAIAAGRASLRYAQQFNVPGLRYSAHLVLGQGAEGQGQALQAARHYQAALVTTQRVQRGLTITLKPGFLEEKGEAARRLIGLYLRHGQAAEALETIERAKSQVLLDYLVNRETLHWSQRDERGRALAEALARLRAEHQWYYRLAHEPQLDPERATAVLPEQARAEVAARERQMRSITEQLYLHASRDRAAQAAPAVSLDIIRQRLGDEALVIEYYNDGEQLWAFTLGRCGARAWPLPAKVGEINRLLAQLHLNLTAALRMGPQAPGTRSLAAAAQRLLQRLETHLLAPLRAEHQGRPQLVIVPYGMLHYLPFHLLHDGAAYLIERTEVVIQPAAGLVTRESPRPAAGALALAHSWEGRLPHAQAEAELVTRLFGGECRVEQDARRAALQAPPRQVLHIAAHGQYRLDQPDLSYVQLADGQLYADDLLQADLGYELVTLSACETGRANVTGSEELIGLGRGLLYAGAGALMTSLWAVPDTLTVRLMEHFYGRLRAGAAKAEAMRAAACSLLIETPGLHPAFWGAFQLVGEAGPLSNQPTTQTEVTHDG
jgi:CHAT domain-containing protein